MGDAQCSGYVAAFALGLGDEVTLERYRAPRGGLHWMRLVHHDSGVSVEREYDDTEPAFVVQDELVRQLRAKLSQRDLSWIPARERDQGKG